MTLAPAGWSLALRLLVSGLAIALLTSALGFGLLRNSLHQTVTRSLDTRLDERLSLLTSELGRANTLDGAVLAMEFGEFRQIFSGWYWVLASKTNTYQSRSLWDASLDLRAMQPHEVVVHWLRLEDPKNEPIIGEYRDVVFGGDEYRLYVFAPSRATDLEILRVDQVLLMGQGALVVAWLLLIAVQVRVSLRPLRRLNHAIEGIERGASTLVGAGFGPDLDPIARSMDAVLHRNRSVIERTQNQAADLSHALKKPLAVLAMHAEEPQPSGRALQVHVQAMSRTIDRHLARFGSGAGSTEVVNVASVLRELVGLMQHIHRDRHLTWVLDDRAPVQWRGNTSDLEEMAGNLMDNAGKWAATHVVVRLTGTSDSVVIGVGDDGPGMSDSQLASVTERGRRFDEQVEGHGLGLAIVTDIAAIYGGSLDIGKDADGGLLCRLTLPIDAS